MIAIVFMIGAINLGLGFLLAVMLERPIRIPGLRVRRMRSPKAWHPAKAPSGPATIAKSESPTEEQSAPEPTPADPTSVGNDWAAVPVEEPLAPQSRLDEQLRIARIKLSTECRRLARLDHEAAKPTSEFPLADLRIGYEECRSALNGWQVQLKDCRDRDKYSEQVDQCDQWFQELALEIQKADEAAEAAMASSELDRVSLRQQLQNVFAQVCQLRDRCNDLLARLLRQENRIGELNAEDFTDPKSEVLDRIGMEFAIQEWMVKDPDRVRMVSAMMVDVDHCGRLNEQFGLGMTNGLLCSLRVLLKDLVRKDRGFDRVATIDGQNVMVLLGDTALRNATSGAERIRQNVIATTFEAGALKIELTPSCSVSEWLPTESVDELVARLRKGLMEAKKAGGNCTTVCAPDEIRVAQSSRMQVQSRSIDIDMSGFEHSL